MSQKASEFNSLSEILQKVQNGHKETESVILEILEQDLLIEIVEAYSSLNLMGVLEFITFVTAMELPEDG